MLEPNDHNLPLGSKLYPILVGSFNAQAKLIKERLSGKKSVFYTPTELLRPSDKGLLDETEKIVPVISAIWDAGGKRLYRSIGFDAERWRVNNEYLRRAIKESVLDFAASTQQTFRDDFNLNYEEIKDEIRAEIAAGRLAAGETTDQLTRRIMHYFQDTNRFRARRIAQTEAVRAHHLATVWSARDSKVVVGWQWVETSASCPVCHAIATDANNPTGRRIVRLGQNFAVRGNNPTYKNIQFPPAHPFCRCTIKAILDAAYSGDSKPITWSPAWAA
jgi:hypothetical protein